MLSIEVSLLNELFAFQWITYMDQDDELCYHKKYCIRPFLKIIPNLPHNL